MSSRAEQKRAARETREAAEAVEASAQRRKRLIAMVGGAVLLAVVVVIVLIAASGGDDEPAGDTDIVAMFEGVPQSGIALGDPRAPVTMVEYADLQCPFCKEFSANALPDIVDDYVRTGDLRIELNLLTFIGPDSDKLARAAYAASEDDSMWQFVEAAFAEQGAEGSGYATDEFIDSLASSVGLDGPQLRERGAGEAVSQMIADAKRAASEAGISSTPGFQIGPTKGSLQPLEVSSLEPGEFADAIDEQLAAGG